jgi:hypothetical protein
LTKLLNISLGPQKKRRAIALIKLRPDHTADEQIEAVVELSQSALDSLGLKPGMIKPL